MAHCIWLGDAQAVKQINTITPANVNIGNVFSVTINGKVVSFTATAATIANVTAGLVAALASSIIPEFQEIVWTDQGTYIKAESAVAGVPFTQTSGASGGSATNTTATTQAATGPDFWDNAANWSTGTVPANSDTVTFERINRSVRYGLAQTSVTLTALNILASYTGTIGLRSYASAGYREYRPTYLAIKSAAFNIGQGEGGGSSMLKINASSVETEINVMGTAQQAAEPGLNCVMLLGSHADNVLNVLRGSVGVAVQAGETATMKEVTVGFISQQSSDSKVTLGAGVTITTLEMTGGQVTTNSNIANVTQDGGVLNIQAGAISGTLELRSGVCRYTSAGTIDTLQLQSDATIDFSRDLRARTVDNCTMLKASKLLDPFSTVTFTAGISLGACNLKEITLDVGESRTITLA
jgi:trimeric autotransporter adhesin